MSLGETEVPEELFMEMLQAISDEYTPEKYHVYNYNSNTFTNALCELLLQRGIPIDAKLPSDFRHS